MSSAGAGVRRPAAKPQPICAQTCRARAAKTPAEAGFADVWREDSLAEKAASGLQPVCGAGDAEGPSVEDVGVDHRRPEVAVAEEHLDGADVRTALEQVGGEGVPEGVAGDPLGDSRPPSGLPDRPL